MLVWNPCLALPQSDTAKTVKIETRQNDSVQYEVIVFDPGFETFLISQPQMDFYSESYYKTWNTFYVAEWNNRYITKASSGLYENSIDYDPQIKYGIEVEYRLYNYFRYFEKINHITLIARGH